MILTTLCAGSGGQGVLTMGNVLGNAGMIQGFNATYLPAYGAAVRGGTANCTVSISDEEIASPVVSNPDILVAMNQPSAMAFMNRLVHGGKLIYNASIVADLPKRSDIAYFPVAANELARELGNERSANMILLGSLIRVGQVLTPESVFKSLEILMGGKPALVEVSCRAVTRGYEIINQ